MRYVPYIYIPLISLICYLLILGAFLASRKTKVIRSFILCIIGFMLWTGGSLFMRMQFIPGVYFWYEVSLLSLFTIAFLYFNFVRCFAKAKGFLLNIIWAVGTAVILILTHFEVFLKRPEMVHRTDGSTIFIYTMEWPIVIPSIFFAFIVVSICLMIFRMIRDNGIKSPGLMAIVAGCSAMMIGNLMSIMPNNIFPWDTLAGIVNAFCLLYALYKKRMFKLKLLISRGALLFFSAILVAGASSYFVSPMQTFVINSLDISRDSATVFVVFSFTILTGLIYMLMKKLIDTLFCTEEQQGQTLERFSATVAQTLKTHEILRELAFVTKSEIAVDKVYVCLLQDGKYKAQLSTNSLDSISFSVMEDNPCISLLHSGETCIVMSEFKSNKLYRSMWESEKQLLQSLNIGCIAGIKNGDEVLGIVLLTNKSKNAHFSYNDTAFLGTIGSIVSIALKNAGLYEQVYRESRVDSLTGLYNGKYFNERIEEEFVKEQDGSLTLLFLDVDDFKLYNQLYGIDAGDEVLRQIAGVISINVGNLGIVSRYSGKMFAVILPGGEPRQAYQLAMKILLQVSDLNDMPDRRKYKSITVSGGICAYPYAASTIRELIDNADFATYNAKNNGKNNVSIYSVAEGEATRVSELALSITNSANGTGDLTGYEASASIISALTAAIHAKDHYTFDHSQNVARYSTILASEIGMNKEHLQILYEAALLHDIGKISIPESILCKTSKLDEFEFEIMKGHVYNAIDMIRHLPSMDYVIPAAIGHHERWDGKGYPRGIAKDEIPIAARCLAIADAFDAMTSARPYRNPMPVEKAIEQITDNAGTQFDPQLAIIFVDLIKNRKIKISDDVVSGKPV